MLKEKIIKLVRYIINVFICTIINLKIKRNVRNKHKSKSNNCRQAWC